MILRVFIIAGFVISLAAAGGAFSVYKSYQSEREQRLDNESKLMQSQDAATVLKADVEQQKSRAVDLETQIEALKKVEQDLKSQQAAKEAEIENYKNQIQTKSNELLKLTAQIDEQRQNEKDSVKKGEMAMPFPNTASSAQENGLVKPPFGSETGLAVVDSSMVIPSEAPPSMDSRILTVNRKFNFIVVNLGLRDGLRMGDKVQVMQAGKQKALAQIEKIYDKFSAATLLSEDKGNPVHEGESVQKV